MADQHGLLLAQSVEQTSDVTAEVEDVVCLYFRRGVGAAVAPHVGRHGPVAGRRQGPQLMPPRVPRLGEPMDHQHQRPLPLLGDPHTDTVDADVRERRRSGGRRKSDHCDCKREQNRTPSALLLEFSLTVQRQGRNRLHTRQTAFACHHAAMMVHLPKMIGEVSR